MAEKIETNRRNFIKYSTLSFLALTAAGGVFFAPYLTRPENRLRPPGAVKEKEFLALCIKCGQCLQVCPYHSIKLADITKGNGVGTPYIDPNERGCYACDAVPCVLACPSGALDHSVSKIEDAHMGVAVLKHPDTCLAVLKTPVPKGYNKKMHEFVENVRNKTELEEQVLEKFDQYEGKECTLCADMCPIPNPMGAIAMVRDPQGGQRPEIYEGCIGCGVCQEVCPTQTPSIVVIPRATYEDIYKT
ncbi:MAG: 4Fe-4S dicluster domain-containing protein [Epsilonproteobacteria bacterium]|nr:4Fe-4S dicluster domain-containing protein [Campylobacterota bacterium]